MKQILPIMIISIFINWGYAQTDNLFLDYVTKEINNLEKNIVELRRQNQALEIEIESLRQLDKVKNSLLQQKIEDLYKVNISLNEKELQITFLEEKIENLKRENSDLKYKIDRLKKDLVEANNKSQIYEIRMEEKLRQANKQILAQKAKIKAYQEKFLKFKKENFWGLGVGYGINYSGLGLSIQSRVGNRVGIGFHLGGGYYPPNTSVNTRQLFYNLGVKLYPYYFYFVDFTYTRTAFYFEGDRYKDFIAVSLGRNFNLSQYINLNTAIGLAHSNDIIKDDFIFSFDLGLLFKF